jgi:hypothetical protein
MLSNAARSTFEAIAIGNKGNRSPEHAFQSSMMSHSTNSASTTLAQLKKYTESHEWIELADGGKTG